MTGYGKYGLIICTKIEIRQGLLPSGCEERRDPRKVGSDLSRYAIALTYLVLMFQHDNHFHRPHELCYRHFPLRFCNFSQLCTSSSSLSSLLREIAVRRVGEFQGWQSIVMSTTALLHILPHYDDDDDDIFLPNIHQFINSRSESSLRLAFI